MNNTDKNENNHARYKRRAAIVFSIAGIALLVFIILMQFLLRKQAKSEQALDNERFFSTAVSNLKNNEKELDYLTEGYDESNMTALNNLVEAYSYNNYERLKEMPADEQSQLLLYSTYTMENCLWLLIVDRNADVLISSVAENNGQNVLVDGEIDLTKEQFHDLCDGKLEKLIVDTPYTSEEELEMFGEKLYLYCKPIPGTYEEDGSKYILLAFSSHIIEAAESRMKDVSAWLTSSTVGTNGAVFMVDASSDIIKYGSIKGVDTAGLKASETGFTPEVLKDGYLGRIKINGTLCYGSVKAYSSKLYGENTYIVAAIPERDLYGVNFSVMTWNMCLVIVFSILIMAYSSYMRSESLKNREKMHGLRLPGNLRFSRTLSGRILPVVLTCTLLVFLLSLYFISLMQLSDFFSESVAIEEEVTKNVEENNKLQDDFLSYYDQQYLSRAKMMSLIIELNGDRYFTSSPTKGMTLFDDSDGIGNRKVVKDEYNNRIYVVNSSSDLLRLCDNNNAEDVFLISDTGVTLATSSSYWEYSLSTDPKDSSYEFRDILSGKKDSVIQDAVKDESGRQSQYIGCALYYYTCLDEDGNTRYMRLTDYQKKKNNEEEGEGAGITRHRGVLQIRIDPEAAGLVMEGSKPEYVLANTQISSGGFLMGFEPDDETEDYTVFYSPFESMEGKTATELGIPKKAFLGNYSGFQKLNSEQYLQSFRPSDDYYISTAMPLRSLYKNCLGSAVFCAAFSLLVMFVISCYTIILPDMDANERYREAQDPLAIFGHWETTGRHRKKTPSQVFESIVTGSLIFLGCVFLAAVFFEAFRFGSNSAIVYIISGEWDRGIHIFSLSACFVIIILAAILIRIFSQVTCLIASAFGSRGLTIMRLLTGLLKLAAVAVVVLYCLYLLGIDATRLLASAGIMSVVLGLGAQSLVGDLLAGIFIIMEGSLHVGDYVLIDGVRGKVTEIGLRTTRYEDINQNIRIICNNEMKSFANMSMKYSVVLYNIPVPYDEDYERIRKILNREFLQLYEDNRFLKGIPVCQGIEEFSESSVDLRVRFVCDENDRFDVQRFMHDNIMRIFTDNDIHIPFNQLDVHMDRLLAADPGDSQMQNPFDPDIHLNNEQK